MRCTLYPLMLAASVLVLAFAGLRAGAGDTGPTRSQPAYQPSDAPILQNPGFECSEGLDPQPGIPGLVPRGWTAVLLDGMPTLNSTRVQFSGTCGEDGFIERIEGLDSLAYLSEDIETPPEPGKPFDTAVYQQLQVVPDQVYSLSGWMVSLCGGSFSNPNDCPATYYMAKMLGIDPTGGIDPRAGTIIWDEDRRNFTESYWANLRLAATAQGATMTVFVRVRSPFRWHGNHAFADAVSIVRAPTSHFADLPLVAAGNQTSVRWDGDLGPDITAIPNGTHQLVFDIQVQDSLDGAWTDWLVNQPAGGALFTGGVCNGEATYYLRVRARAEQPAGVAGAWPSHRYVGEWSTPESVSFAQPIPCVPVAFLPLMLR